MIETLKFKSRRVQSQGNALYLSIPCEVHEYWGLMQGLLLDMYLTDTGDIVIKKPVIVKNNALGNDKSEHQRY